MNRMFLFQYMMCATALAFGLSVAANNVEKSRDDRMKKVKLVHAANQNIDGEVFVLGQPSGTNGSNADALNGSVVTTCNATFLDPGGAAGDYGDDQDYVLTFASGNGGPMKFDFGQTFDTESSSDYLEIYDGPSVSSRLLYRISGQHGNAFNRVGEITSSGTTLTVRFVSNSSLTSSGWIASVYCTAPETKVIGCAGGLAPFFYYRETFGTPTMPEDNVGVALPAGFTGYIYRSVDTTVASSNLFDGEYAILKNIKHGWLSYPVSEWHDAPDHTTGDGYMMVINASYEANVVYTNQVNGLSPNTTYVVSAWIFAANARGAIDYCTAEQPSFENIKNVNVSFNILDNANNVVAVNSTGNIQPADPDTIGWKQYSLYYTTGPSESAITFQIVNNASGGCGNDFAIDDIEVSECPSGTVLLPIKLLNFTAAGFDQHSVNLKWTIANDFKNSRFDIARSADGKHWENLSNIRVDRSLNQDNMFSALDANALPGISFYRVSHTDAVGKTSYSMIRSVNLGRFEILRLTPNPCAGLIRGNFFALSAGSATVRITNVAGSLLAQKTLSFHEGDNQFDLSEYIANLAAGQYDVIISFHDHSYHQKLLKQ